MLIKIFRVCFVKPQNHFSDTNVYKQKLHQQILIFFTTKQLEENTEFNTISLMLVN